MCLKVHQANMLPASDWRLDLGSLEVVFTAVFDATR